jgi:hypothetical protein
MGVLRKKTIKSEGITTKKNKGGCLNYTLLY